MLKVLLHDDIDAELSDALKKIEKAIDDLGGKAYLDDLDRLVARQIKRREQAGKAQNLGRDKGKGKAIAQ